MEAREFTGDLDIFEELGAVVLGVSPDSTEKHRKFRAKHDLGVTLLSDPDKKVMAKYGAYGPKTMYGKLVDGVIRSTVLIDPQGKIAHHWPGLRAKGHAVKVLETLTRLSEG